MLTQTETAEYLKCSVRHVQRLARQGRLTPLNIGTGKRPVIRFDEDEVKQFGTGVPVAPIRKSYKWS